MFFFNINEHRNYQRDGSNLLRRNGPNHIRKLLRFLSLNICVTRMECICFQKTHIQFGWVARSQDVWSNTGRLSTGDVMTHHLTLHYSRDPTCQMEISPGAHRSRVMKNGSEFPGDEISPASEKVTVLSKIWDIQCDRKPEWKKDTYLSIVWNIDCCLNRLSSLLLAINGFHLSNF